MNSNRAEDYGVRLDHLLELVPTGGSSGASPSPTRSVQIITANLTTIEENKS